MKRLPTVKWFRNTSNVMWGKAHLPVDQTLLWIGPVFVLIQWKQGR
jgi:hypothetical protein